MTPDREKLRQLAERATKGPWRGVPSDDYQIEASAYPRSYTHRFKGDDTGSALAVFGNRPADFGEANRDLVVAAVNALPSLLDEIERMEAERDAAVTSMKRVQSAAKTIMIGEAAELTRLRAEKAGEWVATKTLDSEREANAILTAEVERLKADLAEARGALANIFAKLDRGGDAPGHSHDVRGIWDADNAPGVAGTRCEWCAQWEAARAASVHSRLSGEGE